MGGALGLMAARSRRRRGGRSCGAIRRSGLRKSITTWCSWRILRSRAEKFPVDGIHGSLQLDNKQAYIGGACLAKSTDGGKAFKFYGCVKNTDLLLDVPDSTQGHFYDGGSIVGSTTGEIFAAWVDVANSQIDVYRSPDENGTFTRISPPFPGLYAKSHPRLRAALDGSIYVASEVKANDGNFYVYLNRYANGSWGTAKQASAFPV